MLEALHHRGQLRVSRRENGSKVYAPARPLGDALPAPERARSLLLLLLALYAPLPEASLRELARMVTETSLPPLARSRAFAALLRDDAVAAVTIDGVRWLWPAAEPVTGEAPARATLLAPFDPVVWDRRRFELFWGWDYRFEAYTPPARRRFGYYALPLLWRERVIGWANAALRDGSLMVETGFAASAPRERGFRRALAEEVARFGDAVGARGVEIVR